MASILAFINGIESAYLYTALIIITIINLILYINLLNAVKKYPSKIANYEIEKKRFIVYIISVVILYPFFCWFREIESRVNVAILFYIMIYFFNGLHVLSDIYNIVKAHVLEKIIKERKSKRLKELGFKDE